MKRNFQLLNKIKIKKRQFFAALRSPSLLSWKDGRKMAG